jgi:hypothetical protein
MSGLGWQFNGWKGRKMSEGFTCRGCGNLFFQAPKCVACGAQKLYDSTVKMQGEQIKTQAEEITRLRAELATARREGMKDAAKWHEVRSMELSGKAGLARNFRQLLRQSDFHMESAAAIRAAAGEGKC